MILGLLLKLIPNIVNKGLRAFKVPMKKSFELRLHNRGGTLVSALVLSLFEANGAMEKYGGKKRTVHSCKA